MITISPFPPSHHFPEVVPPAPDPAPQHHIAELLAVHHVVVHAPDPDPAVNINPLSLEYHHAPSQPVTHIAHHASVGTRLFTPFTHQPT